MVHKKESPHECGLSCPDFTRPSLGARANNVGLFVVALQAGLARASARSWCNGRYGIDERNRDEVGAGRRVGGTRNSRYVRDSNDGTLQLSLGRRAALQRRSPGCRGRVDQDIRCVDRIGSALGRRSGYV